MWLPAKLKSAREIFSLSFEANKKRSIQYLLISKRSVSTRGIRKWLFFGGPEKFVQKSSGVYVIGTIGA
jgi:hypothetical protein